jgi:NAD(P)-dependent dehydrogenase (short-subunit alcohol dehydrogenase family)
VDLTGRTALVTGSSQGIGAVIAAGLVRAGARVGVNGRDPDRLDKSVDRLRAEVPDGDFATVAVDLGTEEGAAGPPSVIAGPTHTEGVEDFVHQLVDRDLPWEEAQRVFMREHRPQSLLQRLIEPDEIAHMVVYLSSDFASATTGGAVRVDGGYVDSILP